MRRAGYRESDDERTFRGIRHPVAHSLSPRIHALFASRPARRCKYDAIDVAPEGFAAALPNSPPAVAAAPTSRCRTSRRRPPCAQRLTERATRAGAANTLTRVGEEWHGDNTDGAGLVRDLTERHALDLRGRRTLLLGAGGAAHGVAPALLDAGIGELFIVNRDSRAPMRWWTRWASPAACTRATGRTSTAWACSNSWSTPLPPAATAVPAIADGDRHPAHAGRGPQLRRRSDPFLAWAAGARCAQAIDGLGMLVEQAAESFHDWFGVRPATDAVYDDLSARAVAPRNRRLKQALALDREVAFDQRGGELRAGDVEHHHALAAQRAVRALAFSR
jgi:shikimate dehydrogenase